jgi:hypothetical protein
MERAEPQPPVPRLLVSHEAGATHDGSEPGAVGLPASNEIRVEPDVLVPAVVAAEGPRTAKGCVEEPSAGETMELTPLLLIWHRPRL